jgi:type III secretion protein T
MLQGVLRNGMVLMFSFYIAFGQPVAFIHMLHGLKLVEIGAREALVGLLLSLPASSVFWVAECVGTYIDDLAGYNNAQLTNPLREGATPTSILLGQIAYVAFWSLGGMMFLLTTLYQSYRLLPLYDTNTVDFGFLESFVSININSLMTDTAKLAGPMLFVLLLVDIVFGLIGKSASKLDIGSLAQPVKGLVAILMMAILINSFIGSLHSKLALQHLSDQVGHLMHGILGDKSN